MSLINFHVFMKDIAEDLVGANKTHKDFIITSRLIAEAIQYQLVENNAVFQNLMGKLHTTAAYVNNLVMDLPLNFDIFLPIRVPLPVTLSFNNEHRTVQITRLRTQHPFFFGNALNFKLMNMVLEQELRGVVKKLAGVIISGVIYDLSYRTHRRGKVPFLHQLLATERGSNNERSISFDFVLALVFDGAESPLPSYYNAHIVGQWLAYGLAGEHRSPENWSVVVPKWKTAEPAVCLRSVSSIIMLYRLMKVQKCRLYAQPHCLKLSFALVTEERGEMYQTMSIADMTLTMLFHEVSRDLYQVAIEHTRRDRFSRSSKLLSIRQQQIRARTIYYILADGANKNEISSEFIFAFFTNLYIPSAPGCSKWTPVKEVDTKPVPDFPLEMECGAPMPKRRKSM